MKLGFARNLDSDCEEKSPKSNPNFLQKWPRILRERERERERTGTTDKVTEIRVVSEENHIKQNEQRERERERDCVRKMKMKIWLRCIFLLELKWFEKF